MEGVLGADVSINQHFAEGFERLLFNENFVSILGAQNRNIDSRSEWISNKFVTSEA